jgi:PiT family inorganic phosphate transporter
MALAWLFTLPVAAVIGGLAGKLAGEGNVGVVVVALVAAIVIAAIYLYSRRSAVTADNVNDEPTVPMTREPALVG